MKIENGYLVFEKDDFIKNKKITATNFSALLGENVFKKKGDALLSIFGIYKEMIDPFYGVRGAIAEKVLKDALVAKGYKVKTWEKTEINYDNFPSHKELGGMIDIAIIEPERCVVECKSKNIKDLEKTKKFPNKDYERQVKFYGFMSKCPKLKLIYVFFTDEQENIMKDGKHANIDYFKAKDVKFYGYDLGFDENEMASDLQKCIDYKKKCYFERKIPIEDISDKVLEAIGIKK